MYSYPSEDSHLRSTGGKRWYKPQTFREKTCFITIIFLGILTLALIITVIALSSRKKSSEVPNSQELCLTSQCLISAASLLNSMDRSVDPCEDFYSYSCGKWIKDHEIRDESIESRASDLQNEIYVELREILDNSKVKDASEIIKSSVNFYRSCLNSKNSNMTANLLQMINEIGGWPLSNSSWKASEKIYENIAKAIKILKVEPVFQLNVKYDDKNTTRNIISISPPKEIQMSALIKFLETILKKNETDMKEDILEMEKLDRIIQEAKENSSEIEILTIKDLSNKTNFNDWLNIIKMIMEGNWVHLEITEEEVIQVENINYFSTLYEKLTDEKINERTFANYIATYAAYVSLKSIGDYQISPIEEIQPWKPCIELSITLLPLVMDHLFIKNKNISESYADEMIKYLRAAFKQLAAKAPWLDDNTRNAAYEKLEAMVEFLGYNPMVLNITFLEEYYEHMEIITDEDVLLNLRKLYKFIINKQFSTLRDYNDRNSWMTFISATTVNAFYNPAQNSITFLAAIQNLPFYDVNRPWYQNFGAIGSVIGHEITHGFDNQGSHRDKYGNLYDWWSPETKEKFEEKTKCFIDQYNNYKISEINETVNGTKTLGENIADNGGLRQAFQAYQNWERKNGKEKLLPGLEEFDSKKLFFLSFANNWCSVYSLEALKSQNMNDVHAIAKYRVIGTVSNMVEFSEVFNCKKNSKMNPEQKCIIW